MTTLTSSAEVISIASGAETFLSTQSSTSTTSATETLKDWMFWQSDADKAQCWTKVYGVLDNEFLWVFNGNHTNRTMVLKIAVASVEVSSEQQLHVVDPCGEEVEICLLDEDSFAKWRLRLEEAAVLTAQFFRMIEIEARQLPRTSAYRGSFVTRQRTKKRA